MFFLQQRIYKAKKSKNDIENDRSHAKNNQHVLQRRQWDDGIFVPLGDVSFFHQPQNNRCSKAKVADENYFGEETQRVMNDEL